LAQQLSNSHTLPVPLCHHRAHGDYVLFRVDSAGKAGDVSLGEYRKYAEDHKALTETAVKHYGAESEQIRSNSPLHGTSKAAVATFRGALWTQIVAERADSAEVDIAEAAEQRVQELVDDVVAAEEGDDADFNPEDDAEALAGDRGTGILHRFSSAAEDRPWRVQLDDALEHIRSIGKEHGEHFAATLCETFYELNGTEPALDQLATLFAKIREEFANEAAEEMDDESGAESEAESESEVDEEWQETLDHVRSTAKRDGRVLVNNICDAFYDDNGEELSLEELTGIWQEIQDELALEAQEEADSEDEQQSDGEAAEYDPENEDDAALAQQDAAEDRAHELDHFLPVLLNTPMVSAKSGGGVSWNVFFDEEQLCEAEESRNLERASRRFQSANGREPTHFDLHRMRLFLAVPTELSEGDESDDIDPEEQPDGAKDDDSAADGVEIIDIE